jgi:hypothetical protein
MIDEWCQLMCADKPLDVYINININDISSISEMKMVSPPQSDVAKRARAPRRIFFQTAFGRVQAHRSLSV